MIIASDLDRTLIFSLRAIEDLDGHLDLSELKPAEFKDGKWISFMTKNSFDILKEIAGIYNFVPITTRTEDQFKRITIFQEDIPVKYAVTTNGANILYNGNSDEDWQKKISQQLKHEAIHQSELKSFLQKEGLFFKGELKHAEHLFYYYLLESRISNDEKRNVNEIVSALGWRVSQQGRKLYFIPKCINKGAALEFIRDREGTEAWAGAGDSVLDMDFMQHCSHRIIPAHGELAEEPDLNGYRITKKSGVYAGEEIIHSLKKLLHSGVR